MIQALAPRKRRGYPWVGLALALAGLVATSAFAQAPPKSKDDDSEKKAAAPAEKGAEKAADGAPGDDDQAASKVAPVEVFKDPRAEAAIGVFKSVAGLKDCREQDVRAVRAMAGGDATDAATVKRFVQGMCYRLTSKTNLNALIARPPGANPRQAVFFAINEAADNLIDALNSAKRGNNTAFLTAYNKELLDNLPKLLDNNLIARTVAMIVLGQTGDRNAWNTYLSVIRDKNQPPVVVVPVVKGLTSLLGGGTRVDAYPATQVIDTAKALVDYLNREEGLPWPIATRVLEALAATRLAALPANQQAAEVASAAMGYLADQDAKYEVRVEAGRTLGLVRVNPAIAKYNFGLVAYNLGVLTTEIGTEIGKTYSDNPVRAEYLASMLGVRVFQAFNGAEGLRDSGGLLHVPSSNPNVGPYQNAIKAIGDQEAAIARVAVELTRAPKGQVPALLKELGDLVAQLKQYLAKNPPKDFHLVPDGGKEFRPDAGGAVADEPAENKKVARDGR